MVPRYNNSVPSNFHGTREIPVPTKMHQVSSTTQSTGGGWSFSVPTSRHRASTTFVTCISIFIYTRVLFSFNLANALLTKLYSDKKRSNKNYSIDLYFLSTKKNVQPSLNSVWNLPERNFRSEI